MKLTIYVNVYSGSSTCGSEICVVLHVMSLNSVYYTCTVMTCWCGYLSGARCRLLHRLLPHFNPDWFYLSGTGLPRLSWKIGL